MKLKYELSSKHFISPLTSLCRFESKVFRKIYFLECILFAISFSLDFINLTEGTFSELAYDLEVSQT